MLFKKADRLISQSLRLVRDITVIATGHTTVNTTRIVKIHSSALELRQAVIDMTRAIIGQFGQFETDDNFEVELLTYQEQRSAYLAKMANVGEIVDDSILDLVNTEMVNLEAKLESTRRCSQVSYRSLDWPIIDCFSVLKQRSQKPTLIRPIYQVYTGVYPFMPKPSAKVPIKPN